MIPNQTILNEVLAGQPYPLLFVTLSGEHLYGFASEDSDYDMRGVHILASREVLGLKPVQSSVAFSSLVRGLDIDLVTHDVIKFFHLLLRKNGYVLEQLFSPLIVRATPDLEELRAVARGCITRHHAFHYLGFSRTEWSLFARETPRSLKPLLYVYRVLLSGIHLMRTGEVLSNLRELNEIYKLPYIEELIARKMSGGESCHFENDPLEFHEKEYRRLCAELEQASDASHLPEEATAQDALHDLLLRIRLRAD